MEIKVLQMVRERVLVIDGDAAFLNQAQVWLQSAGYVVFTAENSAAGLRAFFSSRPDILLIDIGLSGIDGLEVCRRIRDLSDIPVILMASSRQRSDILKGFNLGADDFINKPLDFPELIARMGAVLRRSVANKPEDQPATFHHPEIEINWRSHQVFIRGHQVKLSPIEYKLLTCLIENRGWLVTHQELLRKAWGPDYVSDKRLVKLYIRYLRQKIESDPSRPQLILTERGIGYRFSTQVKEPVN